MRPARTWIVSAADRPVRTEEVDHLARSAEGGLSYRTGEDLPPYLGVWADPRGGNAWHLYSDYPAAQHERFGWKPAADHPHADPGDGRTECLTCGKWVWLVTHSCKEVPVTAAARQRRADQGARANETNLTDQAGGA